VTNRYYTYHLKILDEEIEIIKKDTFSVVIDAINEAVNGNEKVLKVVRENKQFSDLVDYVEILSATKSNIKVISKTEHLLAS